jgi:hypothetical protein
VVYVLSLALSTIGVEVVNMTTLVLTTIAVEVAYVIALVLAATSVDVAYVISLVLTATSVDVAYVMTIGVASAIILTHELVNCCQIPAVVPHCFHRQATSLVISAKALDTTEAASTRTAVGSWRNVSTMSTALLEPLTMASRSASMMCGSEVQKLVRAFQSSETSAVMVVPTKLAAPEDV